MKKHSLLLTAALSLILLGAVPVQAYADDTAETVPYLTAAKQLTVTEDGAAFCMDGENKKTGRFALSPNFKMGDLNNDNAVNAVDAVMILSAAAKSGTSGVEAAEAMTAMFPEEITSVEQAQAFSDVNEDGVVNAKDATQVLIYSARVGTGTADKPLGTHEYWADSEGNLRKGFFTDEATGKLYYADENYQLAESSFDVYRLEEDGSITKVDTQPATEPDTQPDTPPDIQAAGFQTIDGKLYYFDEYGQRVKGWFTIGADTFYGDADGVIQTGTVQIENKVYCFTEYGKMQTGWVETNGYYRYYSPESGALQAGWMTLDGDTYFLQTSGNLIGTRVTGLQMIKGSLYLFDTETGKMQTGTVQTAAVQGEFNAQGKLTGWLNYGDHRFYAQPDGTVVSGQVQIGTDWYYFSQTGMMQTGFVETENGVLYFSSNGKRFSGWLTVGEDHQYFRAEDGIRVTGFQILTLKDGTKIGAFFDQNGNMCKGGFFTDPSTGKTYYIGDNNTAVKGLAIIPSGSDNFYYFDMVDYHMATGWYYMQTVDPESNRIRIGDLHYYDANGKQVVNQTVGTWHIDANGKAVSSEKSVTLPRMRDMIFNANGISASSSTDDETTFNALFNYVRNNGGSRALMTSMTPEQLEAQLFNLDNPLRWTYFASSALQGNAPSSEYIAAELDYLLREAGFACAVMYARNSTGYHYWNAVKVNGKMLNYDAVNGWTELTDDEIAAMGGYDISTMDYYDSLNDMIYN